MAEQRGIDGLDNAKKTTTKLRTNHLLLIGIDDYSEGIPKLNNAVRDALDFKEILLEKYDFEEGNITELLDANATDENILDTFENLIETLTDQDNLLIYFSGHGIFNKKTKRGYWLPVNAKNGRRSSYINNTEVTDFISNTKAHHVFTIVDSCFSEALFMRNVGSTGSERVDKFPSRWALSAGRLEPVSDGSMGSNSPFAKSLLAFLKNEDAGAIWASDVCNFVMKNVAFNSGQTPRGQAIPGVGDQGGQFIFRKKGFTENVDENPTVDAKIPTKGVSESKENATTQPKETSAQPKNMDSWRDEMKGLIAENMKQAMVSLNGGINRSGSKYNDLILLRARLNSAEMDAKRGVVTTSQTNMINNQIRYALIEMIDDLEEEDLKRLWIQRN